MSFPNLFNSLDLANHGTPQHQPAEANRTHQSTPAIQESNLDGSVLDFEDAYGNVTQEPILVNSTTTTPAADPLANIDIDSPGSDVTARDQERPQGPPPDVIAAQYQMNNRHQSPGQNQGQPVQHTDQRAPNHQVGQAQQAHVNQTGATAQSNQPHEGRKGHQWGNYSHHYPAQTQQQQAGYNYQPNYHPNLPALVAQYPPAPSPMYNPQPTYPAHPPPAHRSHQPTPGVSLTKPLSDEPVVERGA